MNNEGECDFTFQISWCRTRKWHFQTFRRPCYIWVLWFHLVDGPSPFATPNYLKTNFENTSNIALSLSEYRKYFLMIAPMLETQCYYICKVLIEMLKTGNILENILLFCKCFRTVKYVCIVHSKSTKYIVHKDLSFNVNYQ